jgi:trehalose-phosphatase
LEADVTGNPPSLTIAKSKYDAVLFDLDGVVTKTAKVHAAAWKRLFDAYLKKRDGDAFEPFDVETDYLRYVDGKPRYDGVKSFLESRDIHLPYGSPSDPPDRETICGLGNKKNRYFLTQLEKGWVEVYPTSVDLIRKLRSRDFKTAIVSSSANCGEVLDAAEIADLFDAKVDGVDSEEQGLRGKPAPDIFIEAARRVGVEPQRAIVVEDAISGVEAGKNGRFGCVIGVDRGRQAEDLKSGGADVVVKDLDEIAVGEESDSGSDAESLPSALESIEEIRRETKGKRLAVFLDYDGTMTPIVRKPEDANMSESMRRTVRDLAGRCTVAVISGRNLSDVKARVGVEGVIYAGSHGFEIAGPKGMHVKSEKGSDFLPVLDRAEKMLQEELGRIQGSQVERKKFSIAVHYRQVEQKDLDAVKDAVERVAKEFPDLRESSGKKIFELQPDIDWNKGKALLWLLEKLDLDGPDVVPLYIGDDTTDEDAFEVLAERGIGIIVRDGPRPTKARYALEDPDQVRTFLEALISEAGGGR